MVALIGSLFGDPELWITRALVVLVAASPCALAISVPLTVVAAIGSASKFGVIIKSGAAFERFGTIRHIAVDKTGTLTRNEPAVTAVLTADGVTETQALEWAAALDVMSRDVVESVEGYAANRRVVSVVVVEVEPAGQRQASFGL
ncbi:hypothetical protein GCM10025863_02140 [Microbacterium suwonense]|uniref:Heavy metal translocating P-type ATPase n=1 Tax=Microbacterium suwonense TaxID=683047 RepID=A0ABN6WYJ1_9MICO|nr:hypothetical protein GCM10025863_02140 [Microbacterium suwonense]